MNSALLLTVLVAITSTSIQPSNAEQVDLQPNVAQNVSISSDVMLKFDGGLSAFLLVLEDTGGNFTTLPDLPVMFKADAYPTSSEHDELVTLTLSDNQVHTVTKQVCGPDSLSHDFRTSTEIYVGFDYAATPFNLRVTLFAPEVDFSIDVYKKLEVSLPSCAPSWSISVSEHSTNLWKARVPLGSTQPTFTRAVLSGTDRVDDLCSYGLVDMGEYPNHKKGYEGPLDYTGIAVTWIHGEQELELPCQLLTANLEVKKADDVVGELFFVLIILGPILLLAAGSAILPWDSICGWDKDALKESLLEQDGDDVPADADAPPPYEASV